MDLIEAQAHCLLSWRLVPKIVLTIAKREATHLKDKDLCDVLVAFHHIDEATAQKVRQTVQQSLSQQAAPAASQELQSSRGQGVLEQAQRQSDLVKTMRFSRPKLADAAAASPPNPDEKATVRFARDQVTGSARQSTSKAIPGSQKDNLLGRRFQNFDALESIASGGHGVVLKAIHKASGRPVALKVLLNHHVYDQKYKLIGRFKREAKFLQSLNHPNIVRAYDYGVDNNDPYLAMEYIEGQDLKNLVRESRTSNRPLNLNWILHVHKTVAQALIYCHNQGVIHRDIKPDNIVIESNSQRPVLVDFGLVKGDPNKLTTYYTTLSATGEIVGTPAFMSPEQLDAKGGYGEIGPASDVWGLAATLFYVLTSRTPYPESSAMALFAALFTKEPRRLKDVDVNAPDWLDDLISQCLVRENTDRLSMTDFLARLERQQ